MAMKPRAMKKMKDGGGATKKIKTPTNKTINAFRNKGKTNERKQTQKKT